ncbi:MAG: rod shape-determining protein [Bacteroidetes bacterium]|nr:rod shape-determining protein [Rhodothermaceae bacterium RA]RMH60846.1 MAG: rod shape-determining protein [Bacteroidota bacterium]
MGLFNFSTDVAIDLGTANTLIYIEGQGIVLNEPSIVAVHRSTRKPIAIGYEAQQMHERTHREIETIRPLKDGVIADFEVAEELIRGLIKKVRSSWITSIRRMVVCVPSGITEVEKRAVRDSAERAGAKQVYLIDEPMAAAIGIGLNVEEPVGNMIVDIGGGTTEIAVIALSGIVIDESIRVGGDELDNAIVQYFKRNHNLLIGHRTAERIKCEVGSAVELDPELEISVKGRDLVSGIPKVRKITSEDVRDALRDTVSQIVAAVVRCLERTPPELGADILERGIMLTGGGGSLKGLDVLIRNRVELPVYVAEDPLTAVVRGTGKVLEDLEHFKKVLS